jgi:hypothetical protein
MKAIKFLVLGLILAFTGTAQGQLSINFTIGTRPDWGPPGYEHARYYYLPDVEAYYDMNTAMFIYISDNTWIHRKHLPARYKYYNLYDGRKIVMTNYRGDRPYFNHKVFKAKYGHANQKAQQRKIIGKKPEVNKRVEVKRKPEINRKSEANRNNQKKGNNQGKKRD